MTDADRSRVIPLVTVMQRGTVRALLSLSVSPNRQTPHTQDEVYVIVRGRGVLFHNGRRDQFEARDFIFVAAGVEHWFEDTATRWPTSSPARSHSR
jgi:mannose-6-phosphate isomerase-like protein (cupin superfamily)